ncbi:unnamed protein product [Clavelina lepadiformis]|uniref:EF-hand domain-containing protein n=1 Tax=Clavelina lepadiformis TaxID=159417 RepID=A0ABP0F1N1_CLALP
MVDLTDQQLDAIKEAFEIFTKTTDFKICYNQVSDLLRALNMNPAEEDIGKLLLRPSKQEMSTKMLSYEEFLPIYVAALNNIVPGTYDDLLEGIRVFDKEGNGTVMGAEVRHVLRTLGEKMNIEDINSVMDGKEDINGALNIESFCKYLVTGISE